MKKPYVYYLECANTQAHIVIGNFEYPSKDIAIVSLGARLLYDLGNGYVLTNTNADHYTVTFKRKRDNKVFLYKLHAGDPSKTSGMSIHGIGQRISFLVRYDEFLQAYGEDRLEAEQGCLDAMEIISPDDLQDLQEGSYEARWDSCAVLAKGYEDGLRQYARLYREDVERSGITMSDIGCKAVDRELDK